MEPKPRRRSQPRSSRDGGVEHRRFGGPSAQVRGRSMTEDGVGSPQRDCPTSVHRRRLPAHMDRRQDAREATRDGAGVNPCGDEIPPRGGSGACGGGSGACGMTCGGESGACGTTCGVVVCHGCSIGASLWGVDRSTWGNGMACAWPMACGWCNSCSTRRTRTGDSPTRDREWSTLCSVHIVRQSVCDVHHYHAVF